MRHKSLPEGSAEKTVKDIRRATRKRHATEEKIRIVLEGLRGECDYRWKSVPLGGLIWAA